ncbi:MAG: VTT domain-containing protein [Anaerolineae bacterium]|nr:VTT domain-containing protein [Anaerolineae bacterium]
MRKLSLRQVLMAVVVVAVVIALLLWGEPIWVIFRDQSRMEVLVQGWGAWGPLAIILLQVLQTIVAPVPGQVIGFVSGYLFGIWWGMLYCMVGMLVGSFLVILLSRRYGRPLVVRLAHPDTLARMYSWIERYAGSPQRAELVLFLIFLLPFVPDDVACLLAGLTSLSIGRIMLLAAIGRLPGLLVPVLIGAGSVEISTGQWALLMAVLILIALLFVRYGERLERWMLDRIARLW